VKSIFYECDLIDFAVISDFIGSETSTQKSGCSPHSDGILSEKDEIVVRIYVRVAFYRG